MMQGSQHKHDHHLGYIGWNLITEPDDIIARGIVSALGAADSWAWITDQHRRSQEPQQVFRTLMDMAGGGNEPANIGTASNLGAGNPLSIGTNERMLQAIERWMTRIDQAEPERHIELIQKLGGCVLTPASTQWPQQFEHPGLIAPLSLWVRGNAQALKVPAVSLVGARAATSYGTHLAGQFSEELSGREWSIISGGAYGIDAAAHRGALACAGTTVAILAGGVDRYYPAGNSALLDGITESGGAVISEMPLGSAPRRVRFLQRNRLIAALGAATVVVEAAWRSGALSTAHHAADLGLPVGAVPGPVTSMASSGCHRLVRSGAAVCVTDTTEILELANPVSVSASDKHPHQAELSLWDGLDETAKRVMDAMPLRRTTTVETLTRVSGLTSAEVLGALGRLQLHGAIKSSGNQWKKCDGEHNLITK